MEYEYLLIGVVLLGVLFLQWNFFAKTRNDIKELAKFFPERDAFHYLSISIDDDTSRGSVRDQNHNLFLDESENEDNDDEVDADVIGEEDDNDDVDVDEIDKDEDDDDSSDGKPISIKNPDVILADSPHLREVISETNRYLRANDGATADFNLLSDICESKILAVEKKAELNLPLPLFIGLMGTFLGVIIGIGFIFFKGERFDFGVIQKFLGGILIAMTGSFCGLLLTTFNTHWYFKRAKDQTEIRKFNYLNFVRATLLPHLNESMSDSFMQLRNTLYHFNNDFKQNVTGFHNTIQQVTRHAETQRDFINEINKVGLQQITESNIRILSEFTRASNEVSKVSNFLSEVSQSYNNLSQVLQYTKDIFSKFNRLDEMMNSLSDSYSNNIRFLESTVRVLDQNYSALNNVSAIVKQNVQSSTDSIKDFVDEEKNKIDLLVQSLREKLIEAFDENAKNMITQELGKIEEMKESIRSLTTTSIELNKKVVSLLEGLSKRPRGDGGIRMSWGEIENYMPGGAFHSNDSLNLKG